MRKVSILIESESEDNLIFLSLSWIFYSLMRSFSASAFFTCFINAFISYESSYLSRLFSDFIRSKSGLSLELVIL